MTREADDRYCRDIGYALEGGVPAEVMDLLGKLSDEQRLLAFTPYCTSCGTKNPACRCWDDE